MSNKEIKHKLTKDKRYLCNQAVNTTEEKCAKHNSSPNVTCINCLKIIYKDNPMKDYFIKQAKKEVQYENT